MGTVYHSCIIQGKSAPHKLPWGIRFFLSGNPPAPDFGMNQRLFRAPNMLELDKISILEWKISLNTYMFCAHIPLPTESPTMKKPALRNTARAQSTDKARKRKNAYRKNEIGWHFCLLRQLRLQISVTYVCVCAFICSLVSLSCRLSQRLTRRLISSCR